MCINDNYKLIEIQAVLMFVKPEGPLEDIKTAVFHHQMEAEFQYLYLHFILSIKYQSLSFQKCC